MQRQAERNLLLPPHIHARSCIVTGLGQCFPLLRSTVVSRRAATVASTMPQAQSLLTATGKRRSGWLRHSSTST
eukprot:365305-Chlamydomonas_euryale.AAC.9